MGVHRVNASRSGALRALHGGPDWRPALEGALDGVAPGAPFCLMVHGYRYTWRPLASDCACPHARLFLDRPVAAEARCRPSRAAWPEALGYAGAGRAAGLAIGFGWEARAPLLGGFAQVYARAARAGAGLARLAAAIAERRPDLTLDMLTHSLGARVALSAMARRPGLPWGRVVCLGAAEYAGPAGAAMGRLAAAGSGACVYHVLSRANDPYDAAFARLAPREIPGDRPLGCAGLGPGRADWIDIQLDHPRTAAWLAQRGMALSRLGERVSHWHFYADPGAMAFYRRLLRRAPGTAPAELRAAGLPETPEPRWSRLLPRPRLAFPDAPEAAPRPAALR